MHQRGREQNYLQYFKIIANRHFIKADDRMGRLEDEGKKIKITDIIAILAILLPLSAFTYWRIFLDKFGENYFECCFTLEDTYYILYYKGTLLWHSFLLLLFATAIVRLAVNFTKYSKVITILFLLFTVPYVSSSSLHFQWLESIAIAVLSVCVFLLTMIYGRTALYGYIALFAMFLMICAKADAIHAQHAAVKKEICTKDGSTILEDKDPNKYSVMSTTKYVLIYDALHKKLEKIEKELIK